MKKKPTAHPLPRELHAKKMVSSLHPSCYVSNSTDCYLAGIFGSVLLVIYNHLNKSWNVIRADKQMNFHDVEIVGTSLYVTQSSSSSGLLAYDLQDSHPKPKVSIKLPDKILGGFKQFETKSPVRFLANSGLLKELYLVEIYFLVEVATTTITAFRVFMLNGNEWKRVESLEDKVAFVSDCKSFVMSNEELGYKRGFVGGNQIYFALSLPSLEDSWLGFKLGTSRLADNTICFFDVPKTDKSGAPVPQWFVPRFW